MSTRTIRTSIGGSLTSQLTKTQPLKSSAFTIGKVLGVLMDENTPSGELFSRDGEWGGIGTIYYIDYPSNKNVSATDLTKLSTAIPFLPNQKYLPLIEELVVLFDLPSPQAQDNSNKSQKYYLSVLNLWNNNQHNSQPANELVLGNTFTENANIKSLLPFEGDSIFEGRTGNSLRFSSTTKFNNRENWWSLTGNNGDPITLLTNGHNYNASSLKPYVEEINNDGSALYLTSTQQVPFNIREFSYNLMFSPIKWNEYANRSQGVLTGDRVVINAKRDEVLIHGYGIGLSSENTIYLNSDTEVVVNAPKISLGLNPEGGMAVEPLLLGNKTVDTLSTLIKELKELATTLKTVQSTPAGTLLLQINQAGNNLYAALEDLTSTTDNLNSLKSNKSYTS
jgi:hypothetical protein